MIPLRKKEYLYKVCEEFFDPSHIVDIKELTTGNINETYVVEFPKCRYILQLLNAHVYYSPIGVMNNTRLIVDHIRKKCIYQGNNPHRSVLNFIKTKLFSRKDLPVHNCIIFFTHKADGMNLTWQILYIFNFYEFQCFVFLDHILLSHIDQILTQVSFLDLMSTSAPLYRLLSFCIFSGFDNYRIF